MFAISAGQLYRICLVPSNLRECEPETRNTWEAAVSNQSATLLATPFLDLLAQYALLGRPEFDPPPLPHAESMSAS